VQHLPDRVGADGRQTIFGPAQGPLQHAQRPRRGAVPRAFRDPLDFGQNAPLLHIGVADRRTAAMPRHHRRQALAVEARHPPRHGVVIAASGLPRGGCVALPVVNRQQRHRPRDLSRRHALPPAQRRQRRPLLRTQGAQRIRLSPRHGPPRDSSPAHIIPNFGPNDPLGDGSLSAKGGVWKT
jgi:hypothetical protein